MTDDYYIVTRLAELTQSLRDTCVETEHTKSFHFGRPWADNNPWYIFIGEL